MAKKTKKPARKKTTTLAVQTLPEVLSLGNMNHITEFSKRLANFIDKNNLSMEIKKGQKKYVLVDGWKFAGINFGIVAMPEKPVKVQTGKLYVFYVKRSKNGNTWDAVAHVTNDNDEYEVLLAKEGANWSKIIITEEYKYECTCLLKRVSNGEIIGQGFALCTNAEEIKVTFDEYAVLSMAQTRAIAKAFRNTIGFIITAAGFESTPAEEMDEKYVKTKPSSNIELDYPKFDNSVSDLLKSCGSRADFLTTVEALKHLHEDPEFQTAVKKIQNEYFPKKQN